MTVKQDDYKVRHNKDILNRIDYLKHQKDQLEEEYKKELDEIQDTINFLNGQLIK